MYWHNDGQYVNITEMRNPDFKWTYPDTLPVLSVFDGRIQRYQCYQYLMDRSDIPVLSINI